MSENPLPKDSHYQLPPETGGEEPVPPVTAQDEIDRIVSSDDDVAVEGDHKEHLTAHLNQKRAILNAAVRGTRPAEHLTRLDRHIAAHRAANSGKN